MRPVETFLPARENITSLEYFEPVKETKEPQKTNVKDDLVVRDERRGFQLERMDYANKEHLRGS